MKILENMNLCCGCHACYNGCPVHAIKMKENEEGFWYPCIDENECIHCNQCKEVCPILKEQVQPFCKIYACYDKNLERRVQSASGGVFALLAERIIEEQGIVVGAAFDSKFMVEHTCINTLEELGKLKGSKYVQSRMGEQYKIIKQYLENNRWVLFSGTACQIAGLKSFLRKDYDKLICVDVICHGVPSPKVWKIYLDEIARHKEIKKIKFRNKENGIQNAPLKIFFTDGTEFVQKYQDNLFIKGFIQNLYLRLSCYQCAFKGAYTPSDISIGDFWGLEKVDPKFGDEYGISLVMIRSKKGEDIIKEISPFLEKKEFQEQDALSDNPCIIESVNKPQERMVFFRDFEKKGFEKTVKKLTKVSFLKRKKIHIAKIKHDIKYQIFLWSRRSLK